MIVIQGKVALESYAENDLDGEVILGFSDTGLATPSLIRAWLKKHISNYRHISRNPSLRNGSMWKEVTCQAPPAAALVDQQSTECCLLTATSPTWSCPLSNTVKSMTLFLSASRRI